MYSPKAKKLIRLLSKISPVAIALSGGLDSSVVAKAAALASKKSIAITIDDYTVPRRDLEDAKKVAELAGITHIIIASTPSPEVLDNPRNRCFHCKSKNYKIIRSTAKKFGTYTIVDGANADDLKEYRPGMMASRKIGIRSPLLELSFGKKDIRLIAREFCLPIWDKPSSACLSSRISCGEKITRKKMEMVEIAEEEIQKRTSIRKVRVRLHGTLARIEVPKESIHVFFNCNLMRKIAKRLREIGFSHVTLDMEGYRPGGA